MNRQAKAWGLYVLGFPLAFAEIRTMIKHVVIAGIAGAACAAGVAQTLYAPYGNGAVHVVPPYAAGLPYGPGPYGYGGAAVIPHGYGSGVVVTPGGAVPYGRYNRDTTRESLRINNAIGGAQAANDAAARAQAPLAPLNPMPGGLR